MSARHLLGALALTLMVSCSTTPSDPAQAAYLENQNLQENRVRQQTVQKGLNNHRQQNQAAAQHRPLPHPAVPVSYKR